MLLTYKSRKSINKRAENSGNNGNFDRPEELGTQQQVQDQDCALDNKNTSTVSPVNTTLPANKAIKIPNMLRCLVHMPHGAQNTFCMRVIVINAH